jgi:Alpha/beta hydrolase family
MAGIAIPLVPALIPVRHLVFHGAPIPAPGQPMADVQAQEDVLGDTHAVARDEQGSSYWTSSEAAIEILYHDCEPTLARAFAARLRPQARTPNEEPCPPEHMPDIPKSYILMREDGMIRPQWSRIAAAQRLGVQPIELSGGHSPMLADPDQLTELLLHVAEDPTPHCARYAGRD